MTKPIEMIFIDALDEFMKLIEALNAGDKTCPVYLAFRNGAMPHWMIATEAIRASFSWQDEEMPTKEIVHRMEKITFVIQPTQMNWPLHDSSLVSVAPFPF